MLAQPLNLSAVGPAHCIHECGAVISHAICSIAWLMCSQKGALHAGLFDSPLKVSDGDGDLVSDRVAPWGQAGEKEEL